MRRTTTKTVWVTMALLLTALVSAAGLGGQERDFDWTGRLEAGRTLEIKGVNGDIEARPADDGEIVLRAEKRGRRSDPAGVRIEVVEHDDGITICAVYPHPRADNRCEPGSDGSMKVEDNDVRVNFDVRVPAGVHFSARTVNGEVDIRDLEGDVEASTVNGDVELSTAGVAEAKTVNGSIDASIASVLDDPLEFSTVNGSIDLDVPEELDADVDVRWVNGSLESDLPITLVGRLSRNRAQGRIGDGGPLLEISTVNGSVRIR